MHRSATTTVLATVATACLLPNIALAGDTPTVATLTAGDRGGLETIFNELRAGFGELNAPNPGSKTDGRRQIDWDAAPDAVSAPNDFPDDFFNFPAFPRARGVVFSTPGTGFQLSATEASGVGIDFSNIDPSYEWTFDSFSPERLFTPIGDNEFDITFKVPGVDRQALSTGFLGVFADVDFDNVTSMEFYDYDGNSLGLFYVPAATDWDGDETFSLLSVQFPEPIVARIRVVLGTHWLAPGVTEADPNVDLVVMDDLVFGEPIPAELIPGDANRSGIVDIDDLLAVLANFGPCPGCPEDFDGDGYVALYDLLTVLANFD